MRPLSEVIAQVMREADVGPRRRRKYPPDWRDYARPYVAALLNNAPGRKVGGNKPIVLVNKLLQHLQDWKGPNARALKQELRQAALDEDRPDAPNPPDRP